MNSPGTAVIALMEPAYIALLESGELERRVEQPSAQLADCDLYARYCHVNRFKGVRGAMCRTGVRAIVHSYGAHHGEEAPLSSWRGSGTIFFIWCSLRCEFCQNWEISQKGRGWETEAEDLAEMMLILRPQGFHNNYFVTPSHVVAQILEAVLLAARQGLALPLFDGVIDIIYAGHEIR